jgi:phosphodiesterase/alkaline phosphatase D-like protein
MEITFKISKNKIMKNFLSLLLGILILQVSFSKPINGNNLSGSNRIYCSNYGHITPNPTAQTDSAIIMSMDSVILFGTVNPSGYTVTVSFEWGTTTNYGNTATCVQGSISGSASTPVTCKIGNLLPNTQYYYRVVATYNSTNITGSDLVFSTYALAPEASTDSALSVTYISTKLNGIVNPNNDYTSVWFNWGKTSAYGNIAYADQSPVIGYNDTSVSVTITNLESYTVYHYQVVALNSVDTVYGSDMTFKTIGIAPDVITDTASSITSVSATLHGNVFTNDDIHKNYGINDQTVVYFQWGTSSSYGNLIYTAQNPLIGRVDTNVSANLSGLHPNTTYHYRAVAINSIDTGYGSDMTFTTVAIAPNVTTNSATSVTIINARLNATVNANNDNTYVYFQWDTCTNYQFTNVPGQGQVNGYQDTVVSFTLNRLEAHTTYHYRIVAINSVDTSFGNDISFSTLGFAPTIHSQFASEIGVDSVNLNAVIDPNNEDTYVKFEWGTSTSYGYSTPFNQDPYIDTLDINIRYHLTSLNPNTLYHYRVVAQNHTGTSYSSDNTFTTLAKAPTATTTSAMAITGYNASLNGTVNANNSITNIIFQWGTTTSYGQNVSAMPSQVSGTSNNNVNYSLSGLNPNTTYHYRVVATNAGGTTYGSDIQFTTSVVAPDATTQAATAISINNSTLNATVNPKNSSTTVFFQWGLTTSYGNQAIAGTQLSGISPISVSLSISGLSINTTYHYRVKAVNAGGTTFGADGTFTTPSFGPTTYIELTTKDVSALNSTSAISGGDFMETGYLPVLQKGICWSLNHNPDVTLTTKTNEGPGSGSFISTLTNLNSKSTYYIRSYAVNEIGITYGNEVVLLADRVTGINQSTTTKQFEIYSFAKKAYIKANITDHNSKGKIVVYNLSGKIVATAEVTEEVNIIDLSFCNTGYYLVRVISNNTISSEKLFIE